MKLFNKGLILAVMAACFVSSVFADKTKEELLSAVGSAQELSDRKTCLWFSSYGKFPQAIVYDSNKDEVRSILFACDTNGSVNFIEKSNDFENMVPALLKTSKPLAHTFIEKKHKGFVADKMVMKILSSNDFKAQFKTPFMKSECESIMFHKWVFESVEQLESFVKYLSKIGVAPSEKKPLVVLEVKKNLNSLTDETAAFLNERFNIVGMSNPENREIADEIVATIKQASQDAADYATIQVAKSLRDLVLEDIDKTFDGFESKKLAKKAIMILTVAVVIGVPGYILFKTVNPLADAYVFDPFVLWAREKSPWLNNIIKALAAQVTSNGQKRAALNT